MEWSTPFLGVQHLDTGRPGRLPQFTIETDGVLFHAYAITSSIGASHEKWFSSSEEAKSWLERLAAELLRGIAR